MLTFEWARDNRHKDKLAAFVFQFCPPASDKVTDRFPTKREDWLLALQAALEDTIESRMTSDSENKQDLAKRLKLCGKTTKEISEQLNTPERTVRRWVANINCRQSVVSDN